MKSCHFVVILCLVLCYVVTSRYNHHFAQLEAATRELWRHSNFVVKLQGVFSSTNLNCYKKKVLHYLQSLARYVLQKV